MRLGVFISSGSETRMNELPNVSRIYDFVYSKEAWNRKHNIPKFERVHFLDSPYIDEGLSPKWTAQMFTGDTDATVVAELRNAVSTTKIRCR
jgi:hypothetical protein